MTLHIGIGITPATIGDLAPFVPQFQLPAPRERAVQFGNSAAAQYGSGQSIRFRRALFIPVGIGDLYRGQSVAAITEAGATIALHIASPAAPNELEQDFFYALRVGGVGGQIFDSADAIFAPVSQTGLANAVWTWDGLTANPSTLEIS